jgi:hypothetical protein
MPEGAHWSDAENDQAVAAYFAMLAADLRGEPVTKAERYRMLARSLGRSEKSVEFKFQNISAVLLGLGQPWISGLMPKANFQASLVDSVLRWLDAPERCWLAPTPVATGSGQTGEASAPGYAADVPVAGTRISDIPLEAPPTLRNAPLFKEATKLVPLARKFDTAARDARNRALGRAGEEAVLRRERLVLARAGRRDLAEAVEWTADMHGDGAGYDIRSFEPDGRERLIEVKTSYGWERTPFSITRNELEVADRWPDRWLLFRLYDFARKPRAFELRPPLDRHVELIASAYVATPR